MNASKDPLSRKYHVKDTRTGALVGKPVLSSAAAYRKADRLDAAYGAVRYVVIFG